MPDLWPDDISPSTLTTPITILKEQASWLGKRTSNALEGEVRALKAGVYWMIQHPFRYEFVISAPTIGYRFVLFTITHPIEFYPLRLGTAAEIMELDLRSPGKEYIEIPTEEAFKEAIKIILRSGKTRKVLAGLLAQVGAASDEPGIPF